MKIRLFLTAILLAALVAPSFSNTPADAELIARTSVLDGKFVKVQLINLEKLTTTLTVQSLTGEQTFYQKNIRKHNGFVTKLNLEDLPKGRYVLKVEQADESLTQVILIDDNGVRISEFTR